MIEIRGAGIAGSYLAYLLARSGYRVRVYELRKRNKSKACAGGVLPRVLSIMNMKEVEGVDIRSVEIEMGEKIISYHGNLGKSVNRVDLQVFLRELAESEGVKIFYGKPHKKFSRDVMKVIASGSPGGKVMGIEVHSRTAKIKPEGYYFRIYRLGLPVRYAWIFPKIDGYSVGVAGDREWVIRNMDTILRKLDAFGNKTGAYIGIYRDERSFRKDDAWLIGDAANLVDPLNYEGYTGAFYSALYLSQNIRNPNFTPLIKYLRSEWKLLKLASSYPRLAIRFIKFWLRRVYSKEL